MAIEWMVCSACNQRRNPIYQLSDGPDNLGAPKRIYGEHNHKGERCSGSDKPPKEVYWGDSVGSRFPKQESFR